ncbi:MAG: hypothetical protein EHM88_20215 [Candidatus Rokuibacteriota bacterium]|nr:MAG: hypothetical protein EHM88_20215 [Candidatus Rokubacteria bacterium]
MFQVLALAGASALLTATARRLRGSGSWTDGIFALLLLNPGHAQNLIWSFQICFVLVPVLLACSMAASAGVDRLPSQRRLLAIGGPLLLGPLCSASGVILGLVGGAWLLLLAVRPRPVDGAGDDPPEGRAWGGRERLTAAGLGAANWAMVALYLYGYHPHPTHPKPAPLPGLLQTLAEMVGIAFGAGGRWHAAWTTPLTLLLTAGTLSAAVAWWWRSPAHRVAAEALMASAAAAAGLVAIVSWGRSGFGTGIGFAERYAVLSACLICWACLAWCRLPWRRLGRSVQVLAIVAALALYPDNLVIGRDLAYERRADLQALVQDARDGMPLEAMVSRHLAGVYPAPGFFRQSLPMLRAQRLGPFSRAHDEAVLRRRFPGVTAPLVEVRDGDVPVQAGFARGQQGLVVHADGDLVFDVRPGPPRRLSASFGVVTRSVLAAGAPLDPQYDGTGFLVTFRPDDGEPAVLMRRVLDPVRNREDRALVPFDVALPGSGGTLVLSTRAGAPGSEANRSSDWGLWTEIRLD